MAEETEERGSAPVSPPLSEPPVADGKPRRKPANRGKAGGRTRSKLVWLTEAENTQLEAKATAAGLSAASYLRASALGDAGPRARRRPTIEKELLGSAIAELNRVGNNVNQIARMGNIGKDIDPGFYEATGEELRRVLALFREAFFT